MKRWWNKLKYYFKLKQMVITEENIDEFYYEDVFVVPEYNKVTEIKYIPEGCRLINLDGSHKLTRICTIPDTVLKLYLDNTKIKTLPNLPTHLRALSTLDCINLPRWQQAWRRNKEAVDEFKSEIKRRKVNKFIEKL